MNKQTPLRKRFGNLTYKTSNIFSIFHLISKNFSKRPIYVINKRVKNNMSMKTVKKTERNERN